MYDFETDKGDACWYVALSNLTGIDIDLWVIDRHNTPGYAIMYEYDLPNDDGTKHLANAKVERSSVDTVYWEDLMPSLGYDISWRSERPDGEFILMMLISDPQPGRKWEGHAVAVDSDSIIHERGHLLDGEPADGIINGGWCNIILPETPFVTVRERS